MGGRAVGLIYSSHGRSEFFFLWARGPFRSDKKYCNFKRILTVFIYPDCKAKRAAESQESTEAIEDSEKEDHTFPVWSAPPPLPPGSPSDGPVPVRQLSSQILMPQFHSP